MNASAVYTTVIFQLHVQTLLDPLTVHVTNLILEMGKSAASLQVNMSVLFCDAVPCLICHNSAIQWKGRFIRIGRWQIKAYSELTKMFTFQKNGLLDELADYTKKYLHDDRSDLLSFFRTSLPRSSKVKRTRRARGLSSSMFNLLTHLVSSETSLTLFSSMFHRMSELPKFNWCRQKDKLLQYFTMWQWTSRLVSFPGSSG